MYESQTYDAILSRMLARVPGDVDKREGSIIYDALAPAAAELAQMYAELGLNINLFFADSASGEFLTRRAAEYGVNRHASTKAIRKGTFTDGVGEPFDVPISSRYGIDGLIYTVVSQIATGEFNLECETAGAIGNQKFGALLPIDYVAGLAGAQLADIITPGADEETDEALRQRYYSTVRTPGTSGNIADYKQWALDVSGVSGVQVLPLWAGAGTVKVVIIDSDKQPAAVGLVDEVQAYIAPDDTGAGQAPIGVAVTVAAATGISINIATTVILDGSRTISEVSDDFEAQLTSYLSGLAFSSSPNVIYVRIGSLLLDVQGVVDFSGLTVNEGTSNIVVSTGEVAVMGMVNLSE